MSPELRGKLDDLIWSQYGLITRDQAFELGATRNQIDGLCKNGTLVRAARGLYRHRSAPITFSHQVLAAVLKTGAQAAASHQTAAYLWDLMDEHRGRIHVAAPRPRWRDDVFIVHRSTDMAAVFITERRSIPTTTVARTVIDIGATASSWVTERVLDAALRRRLTSIQELTGLVDDLSRQGRRGIGTARKLLAARTVWVETTESELEDQFQRLVSDSDLPSPVGQFEVRGPGGVLVGRVDFAFPAQRLLIELDGYAFHSDPQSFVRDRQRQNALQALGYTILRFTADDLRDRPEAIASQIGILIS